MPRASRHASLGPAFGIAAIVMAALTAPPAPAADLALPLDAQILKALRAKRLVRCPRVDARPRCGGAHYPAGGDRHGRAAAAVGNAQMITARSPGLVMAFAGGHGTTDTVRPGRGIGFEAFAAATRRRRA